MPRLVLVFTAIALVAFGVSRLWATDSIDLSGSGASLPETVYRNWIVEYCRMRPEMRITYAAKGSSTGIRDITSALVDFAGSDAAMSDDELAAAKEATGKGIRMLPMTAGGIVLAYNLPGVDDLRLSRDALAGIFLGEIEHWNDPRIAAHNPDAALPDESVYVVYRADGSGTSYAFTGHLAAISPEFADVVGQSKNPNWPTGSGASKNAGVAAQIKTTPGTIGYVDYSFATTLQRALLENREGEFVEPTLDNMAAALTGAELPDNLRGFVPDPVGPRSYPIVTMTWLLVYDRYPEPERTGLQEFLRWCATTGQEHARPSGYVPLPAWMTERVLAAINAIQVEAVER